MLSNPDTFDWSNVRDYFPILLFIQYIQERFMLNLPFYHAFGFGNLTWSLIVGSTGIVMEKFSRRPYLEAIEKYRVRYLSNLSRKKKIGQTLLPEIYGGSDVVDKKKLRPLKERNKGAYWVTKFDQIVDNFSRISMPIWDVCFQPRMILMVPPILVFLTKQPIVSEFDLSSIEVHSPL